MRLVTHIEQQRTMIEVLSIFIFSLEMGNEKISFWASSIKPQQATVKTGSLEQNLIWRRN